MYCAHIIFYVEVKQVLHCRKIYGIISLEVKYGDVPKWLKGPHSKCGRSGNRRESSNLSISVKTIGITFRWFFIIFANADYYEISPILIFFIYFDILIKSLRSVDCQRRLFALD